MSQQQTKNCITLRGSAQIICEYLKFAINSVLFQRGLYPPESFKAEQQYGMTLLISEDPQIKNFLSNLLSQSEEWIVTKKVDKLSLIILNVANKEVLECWDFNVQYEDGDIELSKEKNETVGSKDLKKIKQEIRDVMLQVAATISFLPLLDCRCSFDVLVHAKTDCDVPEKWSEAEPVNITNAQNVQLKSYSTSLHKMETVKIMHYDKNVQIDIKVAVPEYYISHMLAIPLGGRQVSNKAFSTVIRLDILCYDVMGVDGHIPYFYENFFRLLNSTNER